MLAGQAAGTRCGLSASCVGTTTQRVSCDLGVVAPRLHSCVSFVESEDEPVVRKFLTDVIMRFGELMREERK